MLLPVYTRPYLKSVLGDLLKRPGSLRRGDSRVLIGRPFPSHTLQRSFFVLRVVKRKARQTKVVQASKPGDRQHRYWRDYYVEASRSYDVFSICWNSAQLTPHAQFSTVIEARREAKRLASQ